MKPRTDSSAPQRQWSKFGSTRNLQKTVVAKIESVEVLPITKLNNAVAAVCITIIAVSWGGYAKDYLIEYERLEQSRNALRMIADATIRTVANAFPKALNRDRSIQSPTRKIMSHPTITKTVRCLTLIASPVAMASVDLSETRI